jgi:hypothetical protein
MRKLTIVGACLGLFVPLLARPAAALQSSCNRPYGHLYCIANVGNGVEASLAASPDGSVYTAASGAIDWVYKTANGGRSWSPIRFPSRVPAPLLNEGDVAVAPNGDVYTAYIDLAMPPLLRVFISRDGGLNFEEKLLRGPEAPLDDRPWIQVAGLDASGAGPHVGTITSSATPSTWGSIDGGETWLSQTVARLNRQNADPPLVANPYMDVATNGYSAGSEIMPLPDGGFLFAPSGTWTKDFVTWNTVTGPLRELNVTDNFKISSTGVVYQARFANERKTIEYRWLRPGDTQWSHPFDGPWRQLPSFVQAGRYVTGLTSGVVVAQMALNTFGDMLAFNARDGDQDVLIRVAHADTESPVVTRDNIGPGCTARYDYPTLAFDIRGKAITSFCQGNIGGMVAYEM